MKPSEILDNAANIILRDGWTQGAYFKAPDGIDMSGFELSPEEEKALASAPCCQAGAINRAAYGVAWLYTPNPDQDLRVARMRADTYMYQHIKSIWTDPDGDYDGIVSSPIAWNDRPERTVDEVVAALRKAAEDAREAGE